MMKRITVKLYCYMFRSNLKAQMSSNLYIRFRVVQNKQLNNFQVLLLSLDFKHCTDSLNVEVCVQLAAGSIAV